ncbi:hypothetical protein ACWCQP_36910 [Streptomyces chartreusis]
MQSQQARYPSNHHPAVRGDILTLMEEDLQLGVIVLTRIGQLERAELTGKPLEARVGLPDLSDCRVLRFDTQEHDPGWRNITAVTGAHLPERDLEAATAPPPRYCILYRLQDPVEGPDRRLHLQVLAVAASLEAAVYRLAGTRLNRPQVVRGPRRPARHDASREQAQREARQSASRSGRGHT